MTREEIIAKWAGLTARERDAWVERVVFGGGTYGSFREANGVRVLIPYYTTVISDAWTVLDSFELGIVTKREPGVYRAAVLSGLWADEFASTAPEAIGLAAIIAKLQN
ncbi:hypothetical protein NST07_25975 [Paenibacillus sp. FSL L8-0340]|uniref:hypothetical protein n=1 Tax=Paenibacillus sp. FSL L8-0340 TaxID=2954685 RepID=UPI003158B76C